MPIITGIICSPMTAKRASRRTKEDKTIVDKIMRAEKISQRLRRDIKIHYLSPWTRGEGGDHVPLGNLFIRSWGRRVIFELAGRDVHRLRYRVNFFFLFPTLKH